MTPKDLDAADTGPLSALLDAAALGSDDEFSEIEVFDLEAGPVEDQEVGVPAAAEPPASIVAAPTAAARPTELRPTERPEAEPLDVGLQDVDAFEVELDEADDADDPLYDHTIDDHTIDDHTVDDEDLAGAAAAAPRGEPLALAAASGGSRPAHPTHSATAAEGWRRAVPVAIIAVGAVVVGIAVADLWPGGNPPPATQSAGPAPQATSSAVTLPGVIGGSTAPGAGAAVTGTIPASATAPVGGPGVAPASPAVAAGTATVTVLNQTSVKDLGATEGKRISAAGWKVRRITDVNAREDVTTVFYDDGQQDQAQLLIKTVPTVRRAEPRPLWLLRTGGLIVVVADDAS